MPTAAELEKRIDGKLKELAGDRREVEQARDQVARLEDRSSVVEQLLRDSERRIKRKRAIRRDIEDGFRHGNEITGEPWPAERVERRREVLADEIELEAATKDSLLDRLDVLADKSADAGNRLERWIDEREQDAKRLHQLRRKRDKVAAGEGQLSEHFVVVEFDCHNGDPVPRASYDALEHWCEEVGERARSHFGGRTVHITSGFREIHYNASIGGASNSIHVYDGPWQRPPWAVAVDAWIEGVAPSTVASYLDGLTAVSGLGRYSSFTHSDNRARIGWAAAEWNGP